MVTIGLTNGVKLNVAKSQLNTITRKHNGELEIDFNPHIIHVLKPNGDVAYSFSEIKIEELFGQDVIRGYDYDNKQEVVLPMAQVKCFNLEGSKKGFFDKQEVSCELKK
jgi:hypothetical protein